MKRYFNESYVLVDSRIPTMEEYKSLLNWFYRPTGVSATAAVEKTEEAVAEANLFSDGSTPAFADSAEAAPTVTAEPQTETTTIPETEEIIVESEQTEAVPTPEVQENRACSRNPGADRSGPGCNRRTSCSCRRSAGRDRSPCHSRAGSSRICSCRLHGCGLKYFTFQKPPIII